VNNAGQSWQVLLVGIATNWPFAERPTVSTRELGIPRRRSASTIL
jgi:hypothetical protein